MPMKVRIQTRDEETIKLLTISEMRAETVEFLGRKYRVTTEMLELERDGMPFFRAELEEA